MNHNATMNVNIIGPNDQGMHQGIHHPDGRAYLQKGFEVSSSPSLSSSLDFSSPPLKPEASKSKSKRKSKQTKIMSKDNDKIKDKNKGRDKTKRRRNLSGYNFYMKYHRTVTVTPGLSVDTLKTCRTHEDKRKHVLQVLESDPYRLESGQKRRHRKSHGAIGFKELTMQVANSWRNLDVINKSVFEDIAKEAKHQRQEEESSTPPIETNLVDTILAGSSRRPSFEVQSSSQELTFFEEETLATSSHFPSNDSTPSVAARSVVANVAGAVAAPLSLQHLIPGNSSAPSDASTISNSVMSYTNDLFEPLQITSSVASHSSSFHHPASEEMNIQDVMGLLSEDHLTSGSFPEHNSSHEDSGHIDLHVGKGRSATNNELASFLSRLDWSQL